MKIVIKKGEGYIIKNIDIVLIFMFNIIPLIIGLIYLIISNNIMFYVLFITWLILLTLSIYELITWHDWDDADYGILTFQSITFTFLAWAITGCIIT